MQPSQATLGVGNGTKGAGTIKKQMPKHPVLVQQVPKFWEDKFGLKKKTKQ